MSYDAVVVGARCAGASTALLLARRGYRVLLVDRATFPSDTMSTHWVHQSGLAYLQSWGLLDRVRACGCPPLRSVTFDFGPFSLTGSSPPADGVAEALAPRRFVLDQLLVEAAVEAGAELRQGFAVSELLEEDGAVCGIRGTTAQGTTVTERCRIVVGADGLHSRVARAVDAPEYDAVEPLVSAYYSYWSGVETNGLEMYDRPRRGMGVIPTNDGLTCVVSAWPSSEASAFRADLEANFLATLELAPDLAGRVLAGRREEPFVGTPGIPNRYRRPYGPGWALVGDAGYVKDPITAQGITDAFRDAELLTEAIDAGLSDRQPLVAALERYELLRNQASHDMYELTCLFATLEPPPPDLARFFEVVASDQAEADRFLGVLAGTVAVSDFFAPENMQRVLASA